MERVVDISGFMPRNKLKMRQNRTATQEEKNLANLFHTDHTRHVNRPPHRQHTSTVRNSSTQRTIESARASQNASLKVGWGGNRTVSSPTTSLLLLPHRNLPKSDPATNSLRDAVRRQEDTERITHRGECRARLQVWGLLVHSKGKSITCTPRKD